MRAPPAVSLALVLALPVLAGCFGAVDEAPAAVPDAGLPEAVLRALEYVCPPNGEQEGDLCVARIESQTTSLQEPYLAVDPWRPGVMAIGVNAGHTVGAVDAARPRPGLDLILLDIYVTQDGGKTWTLRQIPYTPAPALAPGAPDVGGSGDPALAFDANGTLHVSGIVNWALYGRGFEIFYTSSPDLGETWSEPVTFTSDGDNDRNWLNVGPDGAVYVPWQNVGDSSEMAYSPDGGRTWAETVAKIDDCITISEVAFDAEGTPLVACGGFGDDGYTGVQVHAFDAATQAFSLRSEVEGPTGVWPQLRALPDGALVLLYEGRGDALGDVLLARSEDGGRTWGQVVDLADLTTLDDAWDGSVPYWVAADPRGALHLLVGGFGGATDLPTGFVSLGGRAELAHLVLAPTLDAVVSEKLLQSEGFPSASAPRTVAPAYGDHYYGIGVTPEGGFLVWTAQETLALTAFVADVPDAVDAAQPTGR